MSYLPLDHKFTIQTFYVRQCVLSKMIPVARTRYTLCRLAIWGGLVAYVGLTLASFFQGIDISFGLAGVVSVLIGGLFHTDTKREYHQLMEDEDRIRRLLDDMGVFFVATRSRVKVYRQGHTKEISPLRDESYA